MADDGTVYQNVALSSDPCPVCLEANGQEMTLGEWQDSEYGMPGSDQRYCGDNCHCILVPTDALASLPAIGEMAKLREDDNSDIGAVVDVGPNEQEMQNLVDEYTTKIGELPRNLFDMPIDEMIDFLSEALTKRKAVEQ